MLEPDGMKVACPVLRGLGAGNGLRLLDYCTIVQMFMHYRV